MKCQHDGCESEETIECRVFYLGSGNKDSDGLSEYDAPQPGTEFFYYCADHAHAEGFCYGCGAFCAGLEAFDFAAEHGNIPGLCEVCNDQLKADTRDDDEGEDAEDEDETWEDLMATEERYGHIETDPRP